jgi:flagellar hook-associated protein 2
MGLSVSGLVSGLDVPTIVSQLMQSESIPQQQLQSQLTTVQLQASTYRAINSRFSALLTAAQAMTSSATWNATTATSSDSRVAVTSTGTAQASTVSFTVTQVAAAESQITNTQPPYSNATAAYGNSTISFTDSTGKQTSLTVGGSGTISDAAGAINAAKLGVTATVVRVGTGQYQLQVAANGTGKSSSFTLDSGGGTTSGAGWTELSAGQDAELSVGTTNTYTVSSPSNTISGFMPGVTMTVTQQTTSPLTVSVVADPQSVGNKMQALVSAANAALSEVGTDTDTGKGSSTSSGRAGPLAGDYGMQSLASKVLSIVSSAVGSLGSPAQIGLQLNSDGTIKFDQSAFVSALKTNPALAQQIVSGIPAQPANGSTAATAAVPGIAAQLVTLATSATDTVTGTLVTLAKGEDSQAKNLQSQIDDWTVRLTARQQALTTQYSNLQTMLSSLQSQQSWLTSMFDTSSSSSSKSSS